MADEKNFGDQAQQQETGDSRLLRESTQATNNYTQAMQQQTKAMGDQHQAWGRLRKEQETFMQGLKRQYDQVKQLSNNFAGMSSAVGSYTDKLKQGTT
ncbi:hypothetical protein LCGC14_0938610, partial [marine sediment metagenome]